MFFPPFQNSSTHRAFLQLPATMERTACRHRKGNGIMTWTNSNWPLRVRRIDTGGLDGPQNPDGWPLRFPWATVLKDSSTSLETKPPGLSPGPHLEFLPMMACYQSRSLSGVWFRRLTMVLSNQCSSSFRNQLRVGDAWTLLSSLQTCRPNQFISAEVSGIHRTSPLVVCCHRYEWSLDVLR